jgi:hypothetical protein
VASQTKASVAHENGPTSAKLKFLLAFGSFVAVLALFVWFVRRRNHQRLVARFERVIASADFGGLELQDCSPEIDDFREDTRQIV